MNRFAIALLLCVPFLLPACAPRRPAQRPRDLMPQSKTDEEPPLLVADGQKILLIQRHRPLQQGDQYDIAAHSVFDAQVKLPAVLLAFATKGSRLESGIKHYDVAGRVAVVAMDASGKPSVFTFTVQTCTGADKEILPPGVVVDAKLTPTGMTYTRRDGVKATREVGQALLGLFDQEKGAGSPPTDKDGSSTPHKIGETWAVEVPPTANRGVGEGSSVTLTDMRASTTLKAMKVQAGVPAVEVESQFQGALHFDALPFGFKAQPAELHATQSILYPLDPALQPLEADRHMDTEILVDGSFLFMPVSADVKVRMDQTIRPVPQSSRP